jgi:uncharacterized protein with von Willebrand factor type A (vWA) domain
MFIDFIYELRKRKVPVGTQEAVALAAALKKGLHESSLDGFYHVARSLLIHSEAYLDDFDLVFSSYFKGIPIESKKLTEELLDWLKDPQRMRELSDEERAMIEELDLAEVLRRFEERLREQKERHDGGNRWIGTGGTSPFGRGGENPSGIRVGAASGGRGAMKTADARAYRGYRSDVVLDVRQIEMALRKLRAFTREGAEQELDIDGTIDATAKNAGELEVITRPPRRPNTRVILMMDVGGSMDPYGELMSQIFSAAKRATHWKELRTYYFHNCVYGRIYNESGFREPITVNDLLADCNKQYKLVMVGDALMAPYELLGAAYGAGEEERVPGVAWLMRLREHFTRSIWLNPERPSAWPGSTIETISSIFPMFQLTLEGLGEGVNELIRGGKR